MKILTQKKKKPAPKVQKYSNFDINLDRAQLRLVIDGLVFVDQYLSKARSKSANELISSFEAALNKKLG